MSGGPVRVGDVLGGLLERTGLGSRLERASAVDEWAARVGPSIAEVTRARQVSDDTLVVEVRSSAWLMELNMMKGEILRRVNQGRDEETRIGRIAFVLGEQSWSAADADGNAGKP